MRNLQSVGAGQDTYRAVCSLGIRYAPALTTAQCGICCHALVVREEEGGE